MKTITADGEIIDAPEPPVPMEPPYFKTPWNHDTDAESARCALTTTDPSRTQQQFAKESDINVILARFLQTGELAITGQPKYMNIDELHDLQDSIVTRHQVEEAWNELPAAVRNILKDPKTFVEYVDHCVSTGDLEPLEELGLVEPREPQPTPPAPEAVPKVAPPEPPKTDSKAVSGHT